MLSLSSSWWQCSQCCGCSPGSAVFVSSWPDSELRERESERERGGERGRERESERERERGGGGEREKGREREGGGGGEREGERERGGRGGGERRGEREGGREGGGGGRDGMKYSRTSCVCLIAEGYKCTLSSLEWDLHDYCKQHEETSCCSDTNQ